MVDVELVRAYNDGRYLLALLEFGLELVFLVMFLVLGLHRRLWQALARWHAPPTHRLGRGLARVLGPGYRAALLFAVVFLLVQYLVGLPISIASRAHGIDHGLAAGTWSRWALDQALAVALGLPLALLLVAGLFPLARRLPRTWWLALGVGAGLLLLGFRVIAPYQVHLFHRLEPLQATQPALARAIDELAATAGVDLGQVLVVDAGRVTASLDAYVDGAGPSRRLVLFDTLLARASEAEVLAAVAHELGHRMDEHPVLDAAKGGLGAIVALGLCALILAALRRVRRLRLGPDHDPANLPALFLALALSLALVSPVGNWLSREKEAAADRRAATLLGDPAPLLALYERLAARNLADPDPPNWAVLLLYDHPPVRARQDALRERMR